MLMENKQQKARQAAKEDKPALTAKNFRKVACRGFDDPLNAYPHAMGWFKDHLYVGTTRANLANRALQLLKNTPERMARVWPVKIPADHFDNDLRAQIWRYHPPTDVWQKVYTSPLALGVDGFEVPISVGFRCMTVFKGRGDAEPALYVPTWASHQTPGSRMLRSVDGVSFEEVSPPGLGIVDNAPRSLRGIVAFKDWLFTSPVVGQKRLEPNVAGAAIVYASDEPAGGAWHVACEPSFGNPNNVSVFNMAVCSGYLYAGTMNIHEGFEIWRTDAEGKPPFRWERVLANGAYRGKLNQIAMTLIGFRDCLYVGSAIQNCSFDFDYNVGPAPSEIIRIHPDGSWDVVIGEPRQTPAGLKVPVSGLGPGFGNPFCGYLWSMCVHEGCLYAGTAVWMMFLRYSGREERWPKKFRSMFTPRNVERLIQRFGCDLWGSRDGNRWRPVTQDGFGNSYNLGVRNQVSSPYGLFAGMANSFTPEVAVRRLAGWQYEDNPRGGIEIWFGSHAHVDPPPARPAMEQIEAAAPAGPPEAGGEDPDDLARETVIRSFYGNTRFRHPGFWTREIKEAGTACENLMEEVLAFIPAKEGKILDVNCGPGATTRYLERYYPGEAITGITTDRGALDTCRQGGGEITFLYRKLPRLKLPAETFAALIWVKGFFPFRDRRRLLGEAFRVLKPGGRLVCFDWVYDPPPARGVWKRAWKSGGHVTSPDVYQDLLAAKGFRDVVLHDVTGPCWEAFRKHLSRSVALYRLESGPRAPTFPDIEAHLLKGEPPVRQAILIAASRPG